jgi:NitT/TauT family transport system permease protein
VTARPAAGTRLAQAASHLWTRPSFHRSLKQGALFGLSLLVLIGVWELVGRLADTLVLPPFSAVVVEFWRLLSDGTLIQATAQSVGALALGMLLSIVIGVTVGALMGRYRAVQYALDVYVDAAMSAPMIAFVPLFILLFGIGYETRVITVIIFAIFPIIINTFVGVRMVEPSLIEMAKSFGANERQMFWQVRLPGAFPLMASGLRLGTSRGVKGVVNGEVLIAVVGLGGLVKQYGNAFSMDSLYAIVIYLVLVAMIILALVDRALHALVRH